MNVLREVRRINQKSIVVKIRIIAFLCILLIASIYAWLYTQQNFSFNNFVGRVELWDVIYIYEGEIQEDELTVALDFYPGKSYAKVIKICNANTKASSIEVELIDVRYFGESKMDYLKDTSNNALNTIDGQEISYSEDGNINNNVINIFGNDEYPFEIGYILNKNYIFSEYNENSPSANPNSQADLTVNFNWDYEKANSDSDSNTTIRDDIDTQIGRDAFDYYNLISNEENAEELKEKVLELKLRIKTSKYYGVIPNE